MATRIYCSSILSRKINLLHLRPARRDILQFFNLAHETQFRAFLFQQWTLKPLVYINSYESTQMEMTIASPDGEETIIDFNSEASCEDCENSSDDSGGMQSISNTEIDIDEEAVEELHIHGGEVETEASEYSTEAGRTSREFQLASVSGVPEIKVVWRKKCRRVLGRKICVNVPHTMTRRSNYKAFVKISTGRIDNRDVEQALKDCALRAARVAGVAGALAALVSGGAGLATVKSTFISEFKSCLRAKAGEFARVASDVRINLFTKKTTGNWR